MTLNIKPNFYSFGQMEHNNPPDLNELNEAPSIEYTSATIPSKVENEAVPIQHSKNIKPHNSETP